LIVAALRTVFLSSTGADLREYREAAFLAIQKLDGWKCVRMEDFGARDWDVNTFCCAQVKQCDLFVAIIGHRFGDGPKESRESYTQRECRAASEAKKPRLLFLAPDDFAIPANLREPEWKLDAQESFRKGLIDSKDRVVSLGFTTPADLAQRIVTGIYHFIQPKGLDAADPCDISKYARSMTLRYGQLELEALTPPDEEDHPEISLAAVFIEQRVRENPPPLELPKDLTEMLLRQREIRIEDLSEGVAIEDVREARAAYYKSPVAPVLDVLTSPINQHLVILGDPGSGKSTLVRYLALALLHPTAHSRVALALPDRVPFLLQLRHYGLLHASGQCKTPREFLAHVSLVETWHLSQEAISEYIDRDGRAVVIFDGLDEIFDPEIREQTCRQIVDFAADRPQVRIIVTSRIIGYHQRIFAAGTFRHFTLQDLDDDQVVSFLERWCATVYQAKPDHGRAHLDRVIRSIQRSTSLRQLARSPMLLTIMAMLARRRELPQERHKLYEHAAGILVEYWDISRYLNQQQILAQIGTDRKMEMLGRIAAAMQRGRGGLAGNYIYQDDLRMEVEGCLKDWQSDPAWRVTEIAQAVVDQLRRRNFILSKYGGNVFGFVHRGFLEYFCASHFKEKFERKRQLTIERLKFEVYGRHWQDRSWHEVLRLICAMVDEQFAGEIIEYLLSGVDLREVPDFSRPYPWYGTNSDRDDGELEVAADSKWLRLPEFYRPFPWNLALAIQCLAEVTNPALIAETARNVLRVICVLFDCCMLGRVELKDFVVEHIVPYAEQIGRQWPHRNELARWLSARQRRNYDWAWLFAEVFGRFVGSVGAESSEVYSALSEYVEHEDEDRRVLAVFALANGWRDRLNTAETLHRRASDDSEPDVRWASISALGTYYCHDSNTARELAERAISDEAPQVRAVACRLLGLHFSGLPTSVPLLVHSATSDGANVVRKAAIETLAQAFPSVAETHEVLGNRAGNDEDPRIRKLAMALETTLRARGLAETTSEDAPRHTL